MPPAANVNTSGAQFRLFPRGALGQTGFCQVRGDLAGRRGLAILAMGGYYLSNVGEIAQG
jgi:hypothetical protein